MSNARNLADLLDSTGDVKSGALDNVAGLPDAIDVNASAPADSLAIDASGNADITGVVKVGTNNTEYANNYLRNKSTGTYYFDNYATSQDFNFRVSNSSALDTTTLTLKADGRGLSQFTAKAWVMANATGTPSIYDSHNISSLTDYETGQLGCNFANSMSNTTYAVIASGWGGYTWTFGYFDRYAGVFRIVGSNGSAYADANEVSAVVFGD